MSDNPAGKVKLTRSRWRGYMLPLLLATAVIGIVGSRLTGRFEFLLPIGGVFTLWTLLWLLTPHEGIEATPIRETPGAFIILGFGVASLATAGMAVAIDVIVFSYPLGAPSKPYHAMLFAPPFLIMFIGAWLADGAAKKHRQSLGP